MESPLYAYVRTVACENDLHDYCVGCTCECHQAIGETFLDAPRYDEPPSVHGLASVVPELKQQYDPDKPMCQDDYEYFTKSGRYDSRANAKLIAAGYSFKIGEVTGTPLYLAPGGEAWYTEKFSLRMLSEATDAN